MNLVQLSAVLAQRFAASAFALVLGLDVVLFFAAAVVVVDVLLDRVERTHFCHVASPFSPSNLKTEREASHAAFAVRHRMKVWDV